MDDKEGQDNPQQQKSKKEPGGGGGGKLQQLVTDFKQVQRNETLQLRLLLTGLQDDNLNNTLYEIKRRGFIPIYQLKQGKMVSLILTLSPKLKTKLMILNNYPPDENFTLSQHIRVYSYSRKIIQRSGIKYSAFFLMHQHEMVNLPTYLSSILLVINLFSCS